MKYTKFRYYFLTLIMGLLFLVKSTESSGQQLLVNEFKYLASDISARENEIVGDNNLPCSLIKIRIGITNASFSSDTEIKKVEKHQGEYWLWVNQGTSSLNITADGYNPLEYKIPVTVEKSNVYVMVVSIIFPEKIIYRDTMPAFVSFATVPPGGKLFINDKFYGTTPIKVNIPYKSFSYKIKHGFYDPVSGIDTINYLIQGETYNLVYQPKKKRTFILPLLGGSEFGPAMGLSGGRLGKTGWYSSILFFSEPYDYDYLGVVKNHSPMEVSLGFVQQIISPLFISLGAGYISSFYQDETTNFRFKYYGGLSMSAGGILRIKKAVLVTMRYSSLNVHDESKSLPFRRVDNLVCIGIGFNFHK